MRPRGPWVIGGSRGGKAMSGRISQKTCTGEMRPSFLMVPRPKNREFCHPHPWESSHLLLRAQQPFPHPSLCPSALRRWGSQTQPPHASGSGRQRARGATRWLHWGRVGKWEVRWGPSPADQPGGSTAAVGLVSVSRCLLTTAWASDGGCGGGSMSRGDS